MKRLAFNGGEISPNMALRSDMDVYARSCTTLTNFDVHATGGISRRRGFSFVADAAQRPSILIPFIYSEDLTYLIELNSDGAPYNLINIYDTQNNQLVAELIHDITQEDIAAHRVTWQQINSILLICSPNAPVLQLKLNDDMSWSCSNYEFKCPPWQTIDIRDRDIKISPESGDKYYSLSFDENEDRQETQCARNDILRASFYVPRQQINTSQFPGVSVLKIAKNDLGVDSSSKYLAGKQIAVKDTHTSCYICVADFDGSRDFTSGCIFPENYMAEGDARFIPADNLSGFDALDPIAGLSASSNYKKGDRLKVTHGYWKLYTCIRKFDGATDFITGCNSLDDYPTHFISGILMHSPATCQGTWKFHCSGTWYGCYEVRRSYDSTDLTDRWDTLGESFSPIGSPVNNILTGDESDEECYLGLFLTRTRYIDDDNVSAGWPAESCQNSLIIPSYKHDMQLKCVSVNNNVFEDISPIQIPLSTTFATKDWSWAAFNARYGYPTLATVHESRLVLAATKAQPQTIWLSKSDDLNNFQTGSLDTSALHLNMATTTQAAICWMLSRGEVIMLGTEDAEWIISSSNGNAITPTTTRIVNHGRVGSAHMPAVQAIDRVLYCERGSGRVYQYGFDWNSNSYISTDLTIFADHIATQAGGIVCGTVQRKPYTRAIFVLADGTLALMTYNTLHQVNAWHRYTTNGQFECVCALPCGTLEDKIYAIVRRSGKRNIECLTPISLTTSSPYLDLGKHDYTSTVETTAFTVPDANEPKRHQAQLKVYITTPTPAAAITARTASTNYSPIAHTGLVTPGWLKICTLSGWSDRPLIGIRVTGHFPAEILAMQVE